MFGIDNRQLNGVLTQKIEQHLLAFKLGKLPKVPIPPEEIEGIELDAILFSRGEFSLEFGELVRASLMTTASPSMIA